MIKWRITLWIVSVCLGISILYAVITEQEEIAKYLGLALVGVATKLVESEESSSNGGK